jgi:hypothetical protein
MADLFESKVPDVMLKVHLEAKSQAEKERRDKANIRLGIYHDDWEDILEGELKQQFVPENYDNVKLSKNISQNPTKQIIKEISLVYKDHPNRVLLTQDKVIQDKTYDEVREYLKLDSLYKQVNRYLNLLNDVLIQVGWDESKQQIKLNIITPAVASVIQEPNEPEQAYAVYYEVEYADSEYNVEKKFIYWDPEYHFLFDEAGNNFAVEDNPEMINPYKILPFVVLHRDQRPGLFWNISEGNDFINGTIGIGTKNTFKDYLFKCQSFKQPWIKVNDPKNAPNAKLRSDPLTSLLIIGDDSETGAIDLQVNFKGIDDTIKESLNAFLNTYGLTADSFSALEVSGKALEIKNRALKEIREDQIEIFRQSEKELFNLIRIVNNYHSKSQISDKLEFKIDYAEMEIHDDPESKRKTADHDLEKGLISPAQYYMIFNPDIKDAENAEKILKENLEKNKELKDAGYSLNDEINNE